MRCSLWKPNNFLFLLYNRGNPGIPKGIIVPCMGHFCVKKLRFCTAPETHAGNERITSIIIIFVFPIIIPISLVESKSLKVGKSLEIKLKYLYPNWGIKTNKTSDSARGLSLVSAELAVQNSFSRPVDLATLQSYKLTTLQPYILTILQHYNLTTLQSFNQKLMKTPSNPQFSPIGPGNCREKTLITTKFLNPKVCFGSQIKLV